MRFYFDQHGHYRGHSSGLLVQGVKFFLGVFILAFVIGWPMLVHGPVAWVLEVMWVILITIVAFSWVASKSHGSHRAPREAAPAGETEPVNSRKEWLPYTGPDRW